MNYRPELINQEGLTHSFLTKENGPAESSLISSATRTAVAQGKGNAGHTHLKVRLEARRRTQRRHSQRNVQTGLAGTKEGSKRGPIEELDTES